MGGTLAERAGEGPGRGQDVLTEPSRLLVRLERELGRGTGLVAIFDYDGTLAPIVASPGAAALAPSMRATLARLVQSERARVAILSGRALADVRTRVALDRVIYGGCHGLEIEGPGLRFRHPHADGADVAAARRALAAGAAAIPGALVEFKGLAVSLHYRRVAPSLRDEALALAVGVARRVKGLRIIAGREVVDLVPRVDWNKGHAARWIARRAARALPSPRPLLLYAGDDVTDEAAFAALRGRAVTVRVGQDRRGAAYAVRGVAGLHVLLRHLARLVR